MQIFIKTKNNVCGSCGLYDVCWKENSEDTKDCFDSLVRLKKDGIYLENKTIPQQFASKCIRSEMISSSFNKLYSVYIIKERIETRINEIQILASEQFVNVSSLHSATCFIASSLSCIIVAPYFIYTNIEILTIYFQIFMNFLQLILICV